MPWIGAISLSAALWLAAELKPGRPLTAREPMTVATPLDNPGEFDGEVEFPKDSSGKMAIGGGRLNKLELTREQAIARAREEAADKKHKFRPASVKGPVTIYRIQGSGAVILN